MKLTTATSFDWFFLTSLILITAIAFYQAYVNLFLGKVSRYSIDALLVFIFLKIGSKETKKRIRAFTKSSDRIFLFGVYAFLTFIGGVYAIIVWLQRMNR